MAKTTKKTKKKLKAKSKTIASPKIRTTVDVHTDLHASLSDSIFKDSFDKFLGDRDDRRKKLNLKENVRASFNRDSSLECSVISEADLTSMGHLPKPYRFTICSTPNVKLINGLNINGINRSKNYSSDLFESYVQFENSFSGTSLKTDITNKRRAQDQICTSLSISKRIRHGEVQDNVLEQPIEKSFKQQNNSSKRLISFSRVATRRKPKLNKKTVEISMLRNDINEIGSLVSVCSGRNSSLQPRTISKYKKLNELSRRKVSKISQKSVQNSSPGEACERVSLDIQEQLSRHNRNNCKNFGRVLRSAKNRINISNNSNTSIVAIGLLSKSEESKVKMSENSSLNIIKSDLGSLESVTSSSFTFSENEYNGSSTKNEVTSSGVSISTRFLGPQDVDLCSTKNAGSCKDESAFFRCLRNKPSKLRLDSADSSNVSNEIASRKESSLTSTSMQHLPAERKSYLVEIGRVLRNSSNDSSDFYGWDFSSKVDSLTTVQKNNLTSCSSNQNIGSDSLIDSVIAKKQSTECSIYGVHRSTLWSSDVSSDLSSHLTSASQPSLNATSTSKLRVNITGSSQLSANIKSSTQLSPNITGSSQVSPNITSASQVSSNITNASHLSPINYSKLDEDNCSSYNVESCESLCSRTSLKTSSDISSKLESTCDKSQEDSCIILDTEGENLPISIIKQELLPDGSILKYSNNSTELSILHSQSGTQLAVNNSSRMQDNNSSSFTSNNVDNSSGSIISTVESSNTSKRVHNSQREVAKHNSNYDDENIASFNKDNTIQRIMSISSKRRTKSTETSIGRVTRNSLKRHAKKLSKESDALKKNDKSFSQLNADNVYTGNRLENYRTTDNTKSSLLLTDTGLDESHQCLRPSKFLRFFKENMTKLTEEPIIRIANNDTILQVTNESNIAPNIKENDLSYDLNTLQSNSTTSKTMVTNNQFLSPREERLQSSIKINSSYVTKRKRNKPNKPVNAAANLPAIMESSVLELTGIEQSAIELPEIRRSVVELPEFERICTLEGDTHKNERQYDDIPTQQGRHSVTLNSGKWRRVLSMYRRHTISMRSAFLLEQTDVESTNQLKISLPNESHRQTLRHSVSCNLSRDDFADFNETVDRRAARRRRTSVLIPTVDVGRITGYDFISIYKARDTILRKCGQSEPLEFADIYSESALRQCRKIGEGVYGEVFMKKTDAGRAVVLKIIPIEGSIEVNGEPQKKFEEVLSEIVIALQLSSLRNDKDYMTSSFAEVVQVRCVQGRYPKHLIDLWELYRDNYQTENDHPEIFTDDQLYIVFELANGGQDLEAFEFANALQSKSAFQQMALALAIAEKKLQFEHRDLHWGNILLSRTDDKYVHFKLNGNILQIPSEGIKVTIIDYTLSRMLYEGIVLYNDLSNDEELFTAHGDYQFDIYRLMKNNLQNDWKRYEPFNNILWLHYIIDKLINGARYKNTKSRKHKTAIEDLMTVRDEITNYKSAFDSVSNVW